MGELDSSLVASRGGILDYMCEEGGWGKMVCSVSWYLDLYAYYAYNLLQGICVS